MSKSDIEEIWRLREEVQRLRTIPYKDKEIRGLLEDIISTLGSFLPGVKFRQGAQGWNYNFGIKEIGIVKVEPVHKGKNSVPQYWRNKQTKAALHVLEIVEAQVRKVNHENS